MTTSAPPEFGSKNLRLPDDLRGPLLQHLTDLKCHYQNLDWAGECGWGERPAIVVIDVAIWWTDPNCFPMGSNVDPIVEAGRAAGIPIFFHDLRLRPRRAAHAAHAQVPAENHARRFTVHGNRPPPRAAR